MSDFSVYGLLGLGRWAPTEIVIAPVYRQWTPQVRLNAKRKKAVFWGSACPRRAAEAWKRVYMADFRREGLKW